MRLFRIQHGEDFVGGTSRFFVAERARIEWDRPAEKLGSEGVLLLRWQSIEGLK